MRRIRPGKYSDVAEQHLHRWYVFYLLHQALLPRLFPLEGESLLLVSNQALASHSILISQRSRRGSARRVERTDLGCKGMTTQRLGMSRIRSAGLRYPSQEHSRGGGKRLSLANGVANRTCPGMCRQACHMQKPFSLRVKIFASSCMLTQTTFHLEPLFLARSRHHSIAAPPSLLRGRSVSATACPTPTSPLRGVRSESTQTPSYSTLGFLNADTAQQWASSVKSGGQVRDQARDS